MKHLLYFYRFGMCFMVVFFLVKDLTHFEKLQYLHFLLDLEFVKGYWCLD
jgi:hypothetical protein